ncbi:MAG: choline dehydrogenase, partial [Acidiferrobacterales bacterium]|nr:choline dehydrogenase [Acidiferrobacterales bacterium]
PALNSVIENEFTPGNSIQTESEIVDYIRQTADTVYHPTSTCIMGSEDRLSVVDNACKVYGIENLRVVDASVFPTVISGNTNAPVIMVAEKIADAMKSKNAAPPNEF